jgi:hypothetical protein
VAAWIRGWGHPVAVPTRRARVPDAAKSMRVGRRILIPKVQLDALLAGTARAPAVGEAADTAVVRLAASQ